MTPQPGQTWRHESGAVRRVTEVTANDVEYTRPYGRGGWCSRKTWRRWAKKARLIDERERE